MFGVRYRTFSFTIKNAHVLVEWTQRAHSPVKTFFWGMLQCMGGFLGNDAVATSGALATYEALDEVVVDVSHLVRQVLVILYVVFFTEVT